MTDEERTTRLNAAFNAMSEGLTEDELADMTSAMTGVKTMADVLRYRDQIQALGRENGAMSLYVFEAGPKEGARQSGHFCFVVRSGSSYRLKNHIRLYEGLQELLGCAPDIIDAEAFAGFDVEAHEERAVEIWRPTDWDSVD